jgi:hypothetical protein
MTPERRELAIKVGRDLIVRALRAQESGQIEGFEVFCDEGDPAIIVAVVPRKSAPVH